VVKAKSGAGTDYKDEVDRLRHMQKEATQVAATALRFCCELEDSLEGI